MQFEFGFRRAPLSATAKKKKEIGSLLRYLRCCWLSAQMAQQIEFHLLIILAFYFIFFPASFGSRPRTSSGEESQNKNTTVGSKNTSQNVTWFHWFGLYCPWEGGLDGRKGGKIGEKAGGAGRQFMAQRKVNSISVAGLTKVLIQRAKSSCQMIGLGDYLIYIIFIPHKMPMLTWISAHNWITK